MKSWRLSDERDSTESVVFCKNCGIKLSSDAKFCAGCGTQIAEDPIGLTAAGEAGSQPPAVPRPMPSTATSSSAVTAELNTAMRGIGTGVKVFAGVTLGGLALLIAALSISDFVHNAHDSSNNLATIASPSAVARAPEALASAHGVAVSQLPTGTYLCELGPFTFAGSAVTVKTSDGGTRTIAFKMHDDSVLLNTAGDEWIAMLTYKGGKLYHPEVGDSIGTMRLKECPKQEDTATVSGGLPLASPIQAAGGDPPAVAPTANENAVQQAEDLVRRHDYGAALELLTPLADQGNAQAQLDLGWFYENGRGVAQDDAQAVVWIRKAADQGLADAQYVLGKRYEHGRGVPLDDAQAIALYRKAAIQGNATAQISLDEMSALGMGLPRY